MKINTVLFAVMITLLATSTHISTLFRHQSRCLLLGEPCSTSKRPCCPIIGDSTYTGPVICFRFREVKCRTIQSTENFKTYMQLVKEVNSTNFKALKDKYWASIFQAKGINKSSCNTAVSASQDLSMFVCVLYFVMVLVSTRGHC